MKKSDLDYENIVDNLRDKRPVLSDQYYNDLFFKYRHKAFTVSEIEKVNQIKLIQDSLTKAINEGQTFKDWQDSMREDQPNFKSFEALTKARKQTIFRNAVNTAYNETRYFDALNNKDIFPFFRYDAINDSLTRPAHLAMDNIILPVDDPFWQSRTPANGHNCRCALIPLTKNQASELGGKTPKRKVDSLVKGGSTTKRTVIDKQTGKPKEVTVKLPPAKADKDFRSPIRNKKDVGLEKHYENEIKKIKSPVVRRSLQDHLKNRSINVDVFLKLLQTIINQ